MRLPTTQPGLPNVLKNKQRLLDHLREAGFYSRKDLTSAGDKLEEWQGSVEHGREHHSPHLLTLLEARMAVCRITLQQLEHELSHLTPELEAVHEELVSILRSLSGCNTRSSVCNLLGVGLQDTFDVQASSPCQKSNNSSPGSSKFRPKYKITPLFPKTTNGLPKTDMQTSSDKCRLSMRPPGTLRLRAVRLFLIYLRDA